MFVLIVAVGNSSSKPSLTSEHQRDLVARILVKFADRGVLSKGLHYLARLVRGCSYQLLEAEKVQTASFEQQMMLLVVVAAAVAKSFFVPSLLWHVCSYWC